MDRPLRKDEIFGLIGAGGFAREVMPFAAKLLGDRADLTFVETEPNLTSLNGYDLISEKAFAASTYGSKTFNIAIADPRVRAQFADKYNKMGYSPASLIAPSVTVYDDVEIGEGAILCHNVVITSNIGIGMFFHANLNSYVAHDCIIGNCVTFGPYVSCHGNVHIGDGAYVGAGALIKQGSKGSPRRIGEGAVIGMGAVVTKDIPPHTTVIGTPARVLERR